MSRSTTTRFRYGVVATAAALALALTGCADPDAEPTSARQQGERAENLTVSLSVDAPQPNETVSLPFEVIVTTDVPLGTITSGAPHMHVWFDDAIDQVMIIEGDSDLIESAPDGATVMHVQVHTHDHVPASEIVDVPLTVEGGGVANRPGPPNDY